jgi:hypothetical protein
MSVGNRSYRVAVQDGSCRKHVVLLRQEMLIDEACEAGLP